MSAERGKPRTEGEQRTAHQQWVDSQHQTVRCGFCPAWSFRGTAAECRDASLAHRQDVHPDRVKYVKPDMSKRCRVTGCDELVATKSGTYANLCRTHRDEMKAQVDRERDARRAAAREAKLAARAPRTNRPVAQPVAATRRAGPLQRPRRMTPERLDECRRRNRAGELIYQIAKSRWQQWGYSSVTTCWQGIKWHLEKDGVEVVKQAGKAGKQTKITGARGDVVRECMDARVSVSYLAGLAWERWGYASDETCSVGIYQFLKRNGIDSPGWSRVVVSDATTGWVVGLLEAAERTDCPGELEAAA